jgi:hypothetical protein
VTCGFVDFEEPQPVAAVARRSPLKTPVYRPLSHVDRTTRRAATGSRRPSLSRLPNAVGDREPAGGSPLAEAIRPSPVARARRECWLDVDDHGRLVSVDVDQLGGVDGLLLVGATIKGADSCVRERPVRETACAVPGIRRSGTKGTAPREERRVLDPTYMVT